MNEMGEYEVTGTREYRGHAPGTTFEARLDPGPEQRAIARGDIKLIRRFTATVQPGSFTYPDGWLPTEASPPQTMRRPNRAPHS